MENVSVWCSVLGLVAFAIVSVVLLVAWKKGLLSTKAMDALRDLIDGVILPEDGPIGTLVYYARLAVRAVEQLVKSGQLDMSTGDKNAIRRDKALELVQEYAATSGPALTEAEINTARSLIEAEVYALHNDSLMTFTNEFAIQPQDDASEDDTSAASTVVQTNDAVTATVKKRSRSTKKPPDDPVATA